ncbi:MULTISPECIES: histidine phosphatase family protein [Dactylosporangium]|uniref:Bifunctional RNase H/acid phosphatase n=2 Tax=Dactylosporangium TaxID=35753 RepID=A0A9W6KMJ6_9ACTN|nr:MULTISPECIES: histidine phosphatase family protein [Dactylosporangium]UAB95161.1 histidine phosphatase family protein [Dactylosporangium vinaceum]UWZ43506.1 histidine phosphatase family protein [Dactylosporangium matsuzakiense]GLL03006.1 bifunctional RNase H/acid phosphatase [Dactylosporangium matsuzakiense]
MRVTVEADGGSRGNPGPAGYGAVVRDETGALLAERFAALGVTTNNVAEYSGLIAGLKAARELGADEVDVRMDSKLVIEQMAGRWQIKHPGLRPLAEEAKALALGFALVRYAWIPREQNKDADRLANKAMDGDSPPAEKRSWSPPSTSAPLRMVVIRHGETPYTAEKRYSGRGDIPLAATGHDQAAKAAARAHQLAPNLAAVISSPLKRCLETASALGDLPLIIEDDLIECDFGEWEGLTYAEVRDRYATEQDKWLASTSVPPPGGESFQQVAMRVRRVVRSLQDRFAGQEIAVVSHVTPIKLLLRDALAASDSFLFRLYLDPCGLSLVDSWPDGGVAVRSVNETAHLS